GKEALFQAILHEQVEHAPLVAALPDGPITDASALLIDLGQRIVARWSDPCEQKLFRIMMSDGLRLATEGRINLFETTGRAQTMAEKLMERLIADGWLREAPPLLLALEFMASFIVWQQVQALHPGHPLVADVDGFVRAHVAHFLRGAGK
ncbi:MAG TPA: TetR/AcrR family transcriptional regulator C-terminal domain-containing protein, partial [Polyangium sp.]|nr:TetR/AcrR family transcriptional regulator C-terminal domain-containing protein [Polyangium sp.]